MAVAFFQALHAFARELVQALPVKPAFKLGISHSGVIFRELTNLILAFSLLAFATIFALLANALALALWTKLGESSFVVLKAVGASALGFILVYPTCALCS